MKNDKLLGLYRLTTPERQKEIEESLGTCFDDLYEIVDGVQENVQRLERAIDRALLGTAFGMGS